MCSRIPQLWMLMVAPGLSLVRVRWLAAGHDAGWLWCRIPAAKQNEASRTIAIETSQGAARGNSALDAPVSVYY